MERILCWFTNGEPCVPHETMVERIFGSTSSFSSVLEIINNNCNPYTNMVMGAIRMNQDYVNQYPIVDEELNADATWFLKLLKDSD